MGWRPANLTAKRIASVLLRAHRSQRVTLPGIGEGVCVDALTTTRLTPGHRLTLGRLWREHGGSELLPNGDALTEELRQALSA